MRWIEFLTGLVGGRVKWEEVRIDRRWGMTQKLTAASAGRKKPVHELYRVVAPCLPFWCLAKRRLRLFHDDCGSLCAAALCNGLGLIFRLAYIARRCAIWSVRT